jgi:hypothetical protein
MIAGRVSLNAARAQVQRDHRLQDVPHIPFHLSVTLHQPAEPGEQEQPDPPGTVLLGLPETAEELGEPVDRDPVVQPHPLAGCIPHDEGLVFPLELLHAPLEP